MTDPGSAKAPAQPAEASTAGGQPGPQREPGPRPAWWPENEPWPPANMQQWRRNTGRLFVRRMLLIVISIVLFISIANVLLWGIGPGLNMLRVGQFGGLQRIFGLLLIAGIIILVVNLIRRTALPLGGVMAAADRVAAGDYTVRVEPRGSRSVQDLIVAFNKMTERLQTEEEQRRRLLADVAHELRTPLSVIRGNAEGVLDGIYPAPEGVAPIVEETKVMARLLDDLQTLSLAEGGILRLHREQTDPVSLAQGVVSAFSPQAADKGIALRSVIDPSAPAPAEIEIDPVRIRQVLANLVNNALRVTPAGGAVTVLTRGGPQGAVQFSVTDTGAGIPEDQAARLFQRFTKSADSGGSGLGLAIARSLVEAHGGSISASNTSAGGAVFWFSLPRPA